MKSFISILLMLFRILFSLQAEDNPLTLQGVIVNLETHCRSFRENNLNLTKATAAYKEGRAILYPVISYTAPLSYMHNPQTQFDYGADTVKMLNANSLAVAPEITLSQYLPTSGSLGVSLKNSFSMEKMGELSPANEAIINYAEAAYNYKDEPVYKNTAHLSLSYSQPLTLENGFRAGLNQIEAYYSIAKNNYLIKRNMIIYNAVNSFLNLQYLQSTLALAEAALLAVENSYQETKENYDLGRTARVQLLKAQAAVKSAEIDATAARDAFNRAFTQFSTYYGVDPGSRIPADFTYPHLPAITDKQEEITAGILKNSTELEIANKNYVIGKASLTKTKVMDAPLLSLGANWQFGTSESNITDIEQAFSSPFGESANPQFYLSLSLTGKITDGDAKKQRIKQAEENLTIAALVVEEKKADLLNQAEKLLSGIAKSTETVEYRALKLEIAQMEYDTGKQNLELGQISQVEFRYLSDDLDRARLYMLQARSDHLLVQLEILMLTGADLWEFFQER